MAKKNNLKSVRLSDEVMDYVVNFEGDGFNQKFENLVLFCMSQEDILRQRISYLDKMIEERLNLLKLSSSLNYLQADIQRFQEQVTALSSDLDKLLNDQ